MLIALVIAVIFHPVVSVIDPAISDMFNNLLNMAMLVYLARMDQKIRPRVEHIDTTVSAHLDEARPGGQRRHDPPHAAT